MKLRFPFCVLLSSLLIAQAARADEVRLVNGDRLTGAVLRMDGNALVLKTDFAGELKIRRAQIVSIISEKPVNVLLNDGTDLEGNLAAANAGRMRIGPQGAASAAEFGIAEVAYINPTPNQSGKGYRISGRVSLGLSFTSGNTDTERLHGDAEIVARGHDNRLTVGAEGSSARDQGRETESRALGHGKYDHFLNGQWFVYGNGSAENDKFKDLNLRTTVGGGSGYQFFEGEPTNLALEGGLDYVDVDRIAGADDTYPAGRWAVRFDHLLFGTRNQFFHDQEGFLSLEDTDDLFLRTRTGVRFPLGNGITGTAQFNLDWENNPSPGRSSTDQAAIFNVGYQW